MGLAILVSCLGLGDMLQPFIPLNHHSSLYYRVALEVAPKFRLDFKEQHHSARDTDYSRAYC
jgi:hypothetical protein